MKYPKLSAAIDELLAKLVRDKGEDAIATLLAIAEGFGEPVTGPPKPVEIPIDKEVKESGD